MIGHGGHSLAAAVARPYLRRRPLSCYNVAITNEFFVGMGNNYEAVMRQ